MLIHKSPEQWERELIYRTLIDLRRDIWELKSIVNEFVRQNPAMEVRAETLEETEKEQIRRALEDYHGNRRLTAQALGIGERTLYRKLKEYGMS
jgi:DNA-binding NtrC family response regulator